MVDFYRLAWMAVMLISVCKGSTKAQQSISLELKIDEDCTSLELFLDSPTRPYCSEVYNYLSPKTSNSKNSKTKNNNNTNKQEATLKTAILQVDEKKKVTCKTGDYFLITYSEDRSCQKNGLAFEKYLEKTDLKDSIVTAHQCFWSKQMDKGKEIRVITVLQDYKKGFDDPEVLENFKNQAKDFDKKLTFMSNFVTIFKKLFEKNIVFNNIVPDAIVVDKQDIQKVYIRKFLFSERGTKLQNNIFYGSSVSDPVKINTSNVKKDIHYTELPGVASMLLLIQDYCINSPQQSILGTPENFQKFKELGKQWADWETKNSYEASVEVDKIPDALLSTILVLFYKNPQVKNGFVTLLEMLDFLKKNKTNPDLVIKKAYSTIGI